ncbi:MAG: SOS response-associated peptidase [Anaerolineales bacterium]|nr:SOS response-associated peptidase [Anaerolineales bacterium]
MCGRFTLTVDADSIQTYFPWLEDIPAQIVPRYNIAPTQPIAVVPNDGRNAVDHFVWGLIPFWAKDPSIGSRMINARAETLAEKNSYKNPFKRRRCLILADGFYEWANVTGQKTKQPFYFRMEDSAPFAFAGLWEEWHSPEGSQLKSAAIITTEPNPLVSKLHARMPVILHPEDYPLWLSMAEQRPQELQHLLTAYPAEKMVAYPVSTAVNSPTNESPENIIPLS